jgi:hypothetical protein
LEGTEESGVFIIYRLSVFSLEPCRISEEILASLLLSIDPVWSSPRLGFCVCCVCVFPDRVLLVLAISTGEERRGRGGGLQGCSIVVMF